MRLFILSIIVISVLGCQTTQHQTQKKDPCETLDEEVRSALCD